MTPPDDETGNDFGIGDRVKLARDIHTDHEGLEGTVIGFIRVDPELIVIALDTGNVLKVEPNDIERRR